MSSQRAGFTTKIRDAINTATESHTLTPEEAARLEANIDALELCTRKHILGASYKSVDTPINDTAALRKYQQLLTKVMGVIHRVPGFAKSMYTDDKIDALDVITTPSYSYGHNEVVNNVRKDITEQESAPTAKVNTTDTAKCPKCGKRRATFVVTQKRSGDEPATTTYTCEECGNIWTVNN